MSPAESMTEKTKIATAPEREPKKRLHKAHRMTALKSKECRIVFLAEYGWNRGTELSASSQYSSCCVGMFFSNIFD